MSKVIIITRDGEYNSEQDFFNAINKMDDEKNGCPYNKNLCIKDECLGSMARLNWDDAKVNIKGHDGNPDTKRICQVLNLDYTEYIKQLEFDNAENWAVEKLKENMRTELSPPYASFSTQKNEVILVLPEKLQIGRNEAIPKFIDFMDWVKRDCSITDDDNILYIHDTQLYGTAIIDTTIFDKYNGINRTEEEGSLFKKLNLSQLTATYKYIAIFRHIIDKTSYFQSHILSKRFGQPNLIDELEKIDSSKTWEDRIKETNEAVKKYKDEIVRKEGTANENV